MTAPLLIMAAGGTGGHMFPAQSLAETLLDRGWRVRLSTDERGARYTGGYPSAVEITEVQAATFARGGAAAKMTVPLRLAAGTAASALSMRADRPAAVAGFGGYPSVPALAAAGLIGVPRVLHEANGVLGRVNRLFAPRVDVVACGTWPTALPDGVTGQHVGNPVRAAVLAKAGAPYAPPGADGPLHVLVIGGSQGARILSDTVPQALAALPGPLRARLVISHQARGEDLPRVRTFYANAGLDADVQDFFTDVPDRMVRAQLVVSRAGASSLADLTVIGRPSILVPFAAAVEDHQTANARPLADAGAAEVVPEAQLETRDMATRIAAILQQPERAVNMAHGSLSLGRPDASDRLADIIVTLAAERRAGTTTGAEA